jgi:hypothetical protein
MPRSFGAEADADVGSGAQQGETVFVDRLRHMDVRARHGQQATRALLRAPSRVSTLYEDLRDTSQAHIAQK